MDKPTEALLQAMDIMIKKNIFSFDITKKGRIVAKTDNTHYDVKIQGVIYNIMSKFQYDIDETVFVLFMQGRNTDLYLYPNK